MNGESWHGSCDIFHAPSGAGAKRRPELEQGLVKRSRGKHGGRMSGDVRPPFYLRPNGQETQKAPSPAPFAFLAGRDASPDGRRRPMGTEQGGSVVPHRAPTWSS